MVWESIFQDIVRRSARLRYVTAISAFTCSKMRPDGFGGMAVLITPSAVVGKSTSDHPGFPERSRPRLGRRARRSLNGLPQAAWLQSRGRLRSESERNAGSGVNPGR
jgi:hypothetical protein